MEEIGVGVGSADEELAIVNQEKRRRAVAEGINAANSNVLASV